MSLPRPIRFTAEDAHTAYDEWGAKYLTGMMENLNGSM
jgi:hypothetical protein